MSNGLLKFGAFITPVLASLVVWVLIVPPAAPVVLVLTLLLLTGVGEGLAARVLIGARLLDPFERETFAPVLAAVAATGFAEPEIELRTGGQLALTAPFGRRCVVVADDIAEVVVQGRANVEVVATLIAHAAAGARAGLMRSDAALLLWCTPWRLLSMLGFPPKRGVFGFAWKMRFVVLTIAVVQNWERPWAATGIAFMAVLTYLHPWASDRWEERIDDVQDAAVVELGLGKAMADILRTGGPSRRLATRIRRLDPPAERPQLRVVS